MSHPERPPAERTQTVRDALAALLRQGPRTAKELSGEAHIPEKDVADHLAHLERSAEHQGERLVVHAAQCVACGFTFAGRDRLTRPGKCPRCRATRIDPPAFELVAR